MNQKGFVNIILVVAVITIFVVAGYFVLIKKPQPTIVKQPTPLSTPNVINATKSQALSAINTA